MHRTLEVHSNPNANLSESWRTYPIRIVLFVNALCIPAPQEGVEDLLVAAVVVASETPEGKRGIGDPCDDNTNCKIGLTCDLTTETCVTEGGLVLNALCATFHHPPRKMQRR